MAIHHKDINNIKELLTVYHLSDVCIILFNLI